MTRATPEWIGRTPDTPIPARVKLRIWTREDGRCYLSGKKIMPGDGFQYEHVIALCNGGENREGNIKLALTAKHKEKTALDVAEKSKIARVRAKHLGIAKPKSALSKRDRMKFNWAKGRYEKDSRE